ncbi:MAG: hypothetical protein JWN32_3408 [Solirubrobacterales bacterium]|nr:hypothetical protein [Solirubrobacterales bacterium]
MVVEGPTEVRLIRRLAEELHGAWEGSGLAITDLEGDKLEGSRPMLEGFANADVVALLLDNRNDVARVSARLTEAGVLAEPHVQLWERSLEEDNFTLDELLAMIAELGRRAGATLVLDEEAVLVARETTKAKGLASVLQRLARQPGHGAVVFNKPDLADPMAELILRDARRPIVAWVLAYPVAAMRAEA